MHHAQRHSQVLKTMEARAPLAKTWAQQWDELKAMWNDGTPVEMIAENLGRSVSAVLTQAARLGLARRAAPGRKAKMIETPVQAEKPALVRAGNVISFPPRMEAMVDEAPKHQKKERSCLMCSTSFTSIGSHNRICPRCKAGSAYQSAHDDAFNVMSA